METINEQLKWVSTEKKMLLVQLKEAEIVFSQSLNLVKKIQLRIRSLKLLEEELDGHGN